MNADQIHERGRVKIMVPGDGDLLHATPRSQLHGVKNGYFVAAGRLLLVIRP